jgi:hypothetical protein
MSKNSHLSVVPTDRSALDAVLDDLSGEAATLAAIKAAFDASDAVDRCEQAAPASLALSHLLVRLRAVVEALDQAIVDQGRAKVGEP